jgi:predicted transcriptional regulator
MNNALSRDEFDALFQVSKMGRLEKGSKPSACVLRNAKKLVGIKMLIARRDGSYDLTDKGAEALFVNRCIAGLRALSIKPESKLDEEVATFLGRKGHIVATADGRFEVTPKGRECLEDIAQNP